LATWVSHGPPSPQPSPASGRGSEYGLPLPCTRGRACEGAGWGEGATRGAAEHGRQSAGRLRRRGAYHRAKRRRAATIAAVKRSERAVKRRLLPAHALRASTLASQPAAHGMPAAQAPQTHPGTTHEPLEAEPPLHHRVPGRRQPHRPVDHAHHRMRVREAAPHDGAALVDQGPDGAVATRATSRLARGRVIVNEVVFSATIRSATARRDFVCAACEPVARYGREICLLASPWGCATLWSP